MKKRIALLCALLLVFSALPIVAGADWVPGGDGPRYWEGSYMYSVQDGKAWIVRYQSEEYVEELIVPDTLGGYPVTQIVEYAFEGCNAERVVIPEGVETLLAHAFGGSLCTEVVMPNSLRKLQCPVFSCNPNLERVVLPSVACEVNGVLFEQCDALREVRIPEGMVAIGTVAHSCKSLETIYLPASLTAMAGAPAINCPAIADVVIAEGNNTFYFEDNCLLSRDGMLLWAREGAVVPTDGRVKKIGQGAFYNAEWLNEIVIPEGVTEIGEYAFGNCTSLTRATLPEGVTEIDRSAFGNCTLLMCVTFPDGLQSIGLDCFRGCASLTELSLPDTLVSIGSYAFWNCESLRNVVVPDSVTTMGDGVFMQCTALETLTVSSSLESLPSQMVLSCESLREIIVPEGVKKLEVGALFAPNLERIVLPSTLTELESNVFTPSEKLIELTVAEGNPVFYADGYSLMQYDGTLVRMFRGETFPEGVTAIGDYAFKSRRDLTEFVIPDGIKSIGQDAFDNCGSLRSVIVPDSVEYIGGGAFAYTALKGFFVPASVKRVGYSVFEGCKALACIDFEAGEKPENWNEYNYEHHGGKYRMNAKRNEERELVEENGIAYEIKDGVAIVRDLTATDMLDLVIPAEVNGCPVTEIGERAFATKEFRSIVLPDTVVTIREGAFEDCHGLSAVRFPSALVTVGENAFNGCYMMNSVYLAETVETVGWNAFWACGHAGFVIECGAEELPEGWAEVWHNPDIEIRWGVAPRETSDEVSDESSKESTDESEEVSEESIAESTEPSETPSVSVSREPSAAETSSEGVSSLPPVSSDVSETQGDDGVSPVVWIVIGVLAIAAGAVGACLYLRKKK